MGSESGYQALNEVLDGINAEPGEIRIEVQALGLRTHRELV